MVFTSEHKSFITQSYFRNGVFNNGEWIYSAVACITQVYATKNTSMHSRASERLDLDVRSKSQRLL
jgi:hypothetical protein